MPGLSSLIQKLKNELPGLGEPEACHRTCSILQQFCAEKVELPERVCQRGQNGYARHLIHQNGERGFCLVAMVWAPGQGTALHDHGGTWCVEGCLQGKLAITSYRLVEERSPQQLRFEAEQMVEAGPGAVGYLIPPFEHHTIRNPYDQVAISLHCYACELDQCTRFVPAEEGFYRPERVPMSYCTRPEALC